MPRPQIPMHDALDQPLPLGERIDAGATFPTFLARHARVCEAQADVIRGLLYLATVTERIVTAVPDLCWHRDVGRGQRTLTNTLTAATKAYLALHGRQLVTSPMSSPSLSEQLLAASQNEVNDWLLTVATPPPPGRLEPVPESPSP